MVSLRSFWNDSPDEGVSLVTKDGHHEVVLPLQQPVEVRDAVYGQVVDVSHNVPRPQACAVSWRAFHYSEYKGTSKTARGLEGLTYK